MFFFNGIHLLCHSQTIIVQITSNNVGKISKYIQISFKICRKFRQVKIDPGKSIFQLLNRMGERGSILSVHAAPHFIMQGGTPSLHFIMTTVVLCRQSAELDLLLVLSFAVKDG